MEIEIMIPVFIDVLQHFWDNLMLIIINFTKFLMYLNMIYFSFNSYCSYFFGMETWHDDMMLNPNSYRKNSVAYHKAIVDNVKWMFVTIFPVKKWILHCFRNNKPRGLSIFTGMKSIPKVYVYVDYSIVIYVIHCLLKMFGDI